MRGAAVYIRTRSGRKCAFAGFTGRACVVAVVPLVGFPKRTDSTAMKNTIDAQMAGLAEHLGNQRKLILKRWRAATEDAPGVTIASSLTRV